MCKTGLFRQAFPPFFKNNEITKCQCYGTAQIVASRTASIFNICIDSSIYHLPFFIAMYLNFVTPLWHAVPQTVFGALGSFQFSSLYEMFVFLEELPLYRAPPNPQLRRSTIGLAQISPQKVVIQAGKICVSHVLKIFHIPKQHIWKTLYVTALQSPPPSFEFALRSLHITIQCTSGTLRRCSPPKLRRVSEVYKMDGSLASKKLGGQYHILLFLFYPFSSWATH